MYRHILIPTDGSELAEHGVAHGLALAKSLGAKVTVIIVEEPYPSYWHGFAGHGHLKNSPTLPCRSRNTLRACWTAWPMRPNRPVCPATRFRWQTRNPIKPSLQRPRTGAAISSSWHRTGAAAYPHLCSAV